ncbi:MAG: hypothetical protein DI570_00530 [Phenylobacterium zucineum]|nr:MAG: hypothetical protein DI570_00530 [Phenylobacterium zucineum]
MKTVALTMSLSMLALATPALAQTPSATTKVTVPPQTLWLQVQRDQKFIPPEGPPAQIIAVNPYLTPDNFFFATVTEMACAPEGSVLVSGEAWNRGNYTNVGWWRIMPDGAIAALPYRTTANDSTKAPLAYRFSLTPDGSFVTSGRQMIYRVRNGTTQFIAGQNEVTGFRDGVRGAALFKDTDSPIEDDAGNIWISDQGGCALRKISPGGVVTTLIGPDRSTCGSEAPVEERITLGSIAWDNVNKEIVAAGSTIVGKPRHDMHVMVWRIRPDGQARRVYYTLKNGRSPVGQNMDHIWAVAVDPKGRVTVATRQMGGRARRQMMRLDEATARLVPLTGQSLTADHMRPGHEEAPYDGPAARANFREAKSMCYAPDGTLYVLDEHLVRRLGTDGAVRTWAY